LVRLIAPLEQQFVLRIEDGDPRLDWPAAFGVFLSFPTADCQRVFD